MSDQNSENKPRKIETLLAQAEALDTTSLESVQAGMGGIGGACKACHTAYKK
jgi:cytochrome c556